MNPVEIIWEVLTPSLQNTKFWLPTVVGISILCGTYWMVTKLSHWRYRGGVVVMAIGVVAAEYNLLMQWNCNLLYFLAGVLLFLPLLWFLVLFLWNSCRLEKIYKSCGQRSYIEALKLLNTIKPGCLTSQQLHNYQKRRFYLLVELGSLRKARIYLEEICPQKGAFYHFSLHILAFRSGDIKSAFQEIQAAEDSRDFKSSSLLQFQIIMNYGVCYAAEQNYLLADDYYRKAIAFYNDRKLHNNELLGILYYNFAFNQLRLNSSAENWKISLDECQSKLNMKKTDAQICMLNLRLELLRQTEAPKEIIDELLQGALSTIKGCKLPTKNQVLFASSAARVAWAAQANPIPCLNFLNDNLSIIESLSAEQRYHLYTNLDILFHDLHGPVNDSFAKLRTRVSDYLKTDAERDLQQWQNGLPEEAVYARCNCLNEMAILHKNRTPYHRDSVITFQQNTIRLYHDNGLHLGELHTRQDVIDELLDEHNLDKDYRPVCADEVRKHLLLTGDLLSRLEGHPAVAEAYIRLGYYYLRLDDYVQSLNYVRLFWNTNISVQHFAPWLRRYYAVLLLHMRVILFDQAIKEAAKDKRLFSLDKNIRNWFSTYPQHDGTLEALLLGRFLSIPVEKTKIWIPMGENNPQRHTWLWIPKLELNIDLTYPQFFDDQFCQCIFFYKNHHPFEAETSLTLQMSQQSCHRIFKDIICSKNDTGLTEDTKALVDTIYDILRSYIPPECPSMEDIIRLMREFIVPVPIQV